MKWSRKMARRGRIRRLTDRSPTRKPRRSTYRAQRWRVHGASTQGRILFQLACVQPDHRGHDTARARQFYYTGDRRRKMVAVNVVDKWGSRVDKLRSEESYCAKYVGPRATAWRSRESHSPARRALLGERLARPEIYENLRTTTRVQALPAVGHVRCSRQRLPNAGVLRDDNNGLKPDGSPDLNLVTRASRSRIRVVRARRLHGRQSDGALPHTRRLRFRVRSGRRRL